MASSSPPSTSWPTSPKRPRAPEESAACLHTNPVVIRRALAELREGARWRLGRGPPAAISLRDIYVALGERGVLAPVPEPESPGCSIEVTAARALDGFYAEALLRRRLGDISLAALAAAFHRRFVEQTGLSRPTDAATE